MIRTDSHPAETTWSVTDQNGSILGSGGPYDQPNHLYTINLTPVENTCYDFIINDAGSDGIIGGFYRVMTGDVLIGGGLLVDSQDKFQFFGPSGVGNEQILENKQITIIPNPAHYAAKAIFNCITATNVKGVVTDASGRTVIEIPEFRSRSGVNELAIETDKLQPGIYFVTLIAGTGEKYNSKMIVR